MRFYRDPNFILNTYRRLRTFRDFFRTLPPDSYQEPIRTPTIYPDAIYENSNSFVGGEQTYRDMQQHEFDQQISHATSHTGPFSQSPLSESPLPESTVEQEYNPELEEAFIEHAMDNMAELEGDDLGAIEDFFDEAVEQFFGEADDPFDEFAETLDDIVEDAMEDAIADDMLEMDVMEDQIADDIPEMDEMQEMDDPRLMDPYMPFGGFPFPPGG